jgi:hypothetical protein
MRFCHPEPFRYKLFKVASILHKQYSSKYSSCGVHQFVRFGRERTKSTGRLRERPTDFYFRFNSVGGSSGRHRLGTTLRMLYTIAIENRAEKDDSLYFQDFRKDGDWPAATACMAFGTTGQHVLIMVKVNWATKQSKMRN